MNATITVDTRGFQEIVAGMNRALASFGQMTNTDKVLRTYIGRILEGCIRRTHMAAVAKIRKYFKRKGARASGPGIAMSVNDGSRGGVPDLVWYGEEPSVSTTVTSAQRGALQRKAKRGGKVWVLEPEVGEHPGAGMLKRFRALNATRKADIRGKLRQQLAAALGARGLARNSWLQIAQRLGIILSNVAGGAQVAKAVPSTGASYQPGKGIRVVGLGKLYYQISNDYPFGRFKIPGAAILSRSIQAEISYFKTNMRKGVFADLGAIAKKYKGIVVS